MIAVDRSTFYIRTTQLPSGHTNAMAESFFATIRTEWIEGWYNTRRHHSSLGYLSPAAYETNRDTTTANAVA